MRSNGFLLILLAIIAASVAVLVTNDGSPIAGLPDGKFADLARAGIWGLVIGSAALIVFRGNAFGALRSLFVWGLAFALLIAAHAYAPEFRAIGERVLSAVVPGRTVEVAGSGGRSVIVTRSGDDHFHVDAKVDGKRLDFLVDTGASLVALDRRAAEKLGIDTSRLIFSERVTTANGPAKAAMISLDHVQVGRIERRNVRAAVLDVKGDGMLLLGLSFLDTLASFEFRGNRLVMTD